MNRREPKIREDKRLSMKMHVNGNGNENEMRIWLGECVFCFIRSVRKQRLDVE